MNINIIIPLSKIKDEVIEKSFDENVDNDNYNYSLELLEKACNQLIKEKYCFFSLDCSVREHKHTVEEYSNRSDIPIILDYKTAESHAIYDLSKWARSRANYLKRFSLT